MNQITIEGRIVNDAKVLEITTSGKKNTKMAVFQVCDTGAPFQRTEANMYVEVHCLKDYIISMSKRMKSNMHVLITGFLQQKKFRDENGNQKSLYYITADNIKFFDKYKINGD